MTKGNRWTQREERELWNAVGSYSLAWIQRRMGPSFTHPNAPKTRSAGAIYKKVLRLFGEGGLTRGSWTLSQVCKYTGYSRYQIFRAQRALRQRWQRLGPRGYYLITQEQLEEILGWLVHDYWSRKHRLYGCAWCTTETIPLKGAGLCRKCYWRHRRLCIRLGLPIRPSEQFVLLHGTRLEIHGTFLERALSRISAGLALEPADLKEIARAITEGSGGEDGTDS